MCGFSVKVKEDKSFQAEPDTQLCVDVPCRRARFGRPSLKGTRAEQALSLAQRPPSRFLGLWRWSCKFKSYFVYHQETRKESLESALGLVSNLNLDAGDT